MLLESSLTGERVDLRERHPAVAEVAQWFDCGHLPEHLQLVSALFRNLAVDLLKALPDGPELAVALRKLVEAKDAAVRQAVLKQKRAEGG